MDFFIKFDTVKSGGFVVYIAESQDIISQSIAFEP